MSIYWYQGKLIKAANLELKIDDPGLLFGATVFTTLRIYHNSLDSNLTNWQAHCQRLKTSLQSLGWQEPDWERLRYGAELMLEFPVLRITLFPDGRELITGRSLPGELTKKQTYGVFACLASPELQRPLPTHKTGNYLCAWLALGNAHKLDAQEAILVSTAGNWLETSTGNLWGWKDKCWWTPPLSEGILPGIARQRLINWLETHAQQVKEEVWTPECVKDFAALAYSNSVVEIIPIHTVISATTQLKFNPQHPSLQQLCSLYNSGE